NSPDPSQLSTLSLHDALPIWLVAQLNGKPAGPKPAPRSWRQGSASVPLATTAKDASGTLALHQLVESKPEYRALPITVECRAKRSEEHTSELQSLRHLVCRRL